MSKKNKVGAAFTDDGFAMGNISRTNINIPFRSLKVFQHPVSKCVMFSNLHYDVWM
jgi:hypothetical protein